VLMRDARCRLFNDSFCFLGTNDGEYDDNLIAISVHSVLKQILYWVDVRNQQSCNSAFQWTSKVLLHGTTSKTRSHITFTTRQFEGRPDAQTSRQMDRQSDGFGKMFNACKCTCHRLAHDSSVLSFACNTEIVSIGHSCTQREPSFTRSTA
jgi:hypothetical protein